MRVSESAKAAYTVRVDLEDYEDAKAVARFAQKRIDERKARIRVLPGQQSFFEDNPI